MVRLKIYDGTEKIRELELEANTITIGRDEGNSILLEDSSVSRRHATLEPTGGFFIVRDLGSTNGTYVNEVLVHSHVLSHGDLLKVGKYVLHIEAQCDKPGETTQVLVEKLSIPGAGAAKT